MMHYEMWRSLKAREGAYLLKPEKKPGIHPLTKVLIILIVSAFFVARYLLYIYTGI